MSIPVIIRPIPQLQGIVPTMLLVCSFPLILLSRLPYGFSDYIIYIQVALSLLSHFYLISVVGKGIVYRRMMLLWIFLSILLLFNLLATGNTNLKILLYCIVIFPSIALLLFYVKIKWIWCHVLLLFAFSILICRWFIIVGDPEEVTVNSRNYIVYYLFLYALPYYYKCYIEGTRPTIIYPIVCVVLSIIAIGRGSIIMAFILLFGWFFNLVSSSKHKILIILFLGLVLTYLSFNFFNSDFFDLYFSRFEERGVNSDARNIGWIEYTRSLENIQYFLLGTPMDSLSIVKNWGSLHNSYLTLHARLGIFCIGYYFLILKSFVHIYKAKAYFLFFFFLSICVKGFVDADFPGIAVGGDVIIYMLFLMSFSVIPSNKINKLYL